MSMSNSLGRLVMATGLALAAASTGAQAGPVEIKFNTTGSTIAGCGAATTEFNCLSKALLSAGIVWAPSDSISGRFYYENTTVGTLNAPDVITPIGVNNGWTERRTYNGAVDELFLNVGSWLSEHTTTIGNAGDIMVTDNQGLNTDQGTPNPRDIVVTTVTGLPAFTYSFTTASGVKWELDQVQITLTEDPAGGTVPTFFTSAALPTKAQWEDLLTWDIESISVRFNPDCTTPPVHASCINTNRDIDGTLTFLVVPEPASLALLGIGLLGLGFSTRRRQRA